MRGGIVPSASDVADTGGVAGTDHRTTSARAVDPPEVVHAGDGAVGHAGAASPGLVSAIEFYEPMADGYDAEFEVPHRRAYDDLAWERVQELLGGQPRQVVDAGCGTGRLAARLVAQGHSVLGLEPTPSMADAAAARWTAHQFELQRRGIEDADVQPACADLVMAMGSVQFTEDPVAAIGRMASWVRPGGHLLVLCDSLVALVHELIRLGDLGQALERGRTRRALWQRDGLAVEHHLLDAARLRGAFLAAGLEDVTVSGLLVAFTTMGREEWTRAASAHHTDVLELERSLSHIEELADSGKQLLAVGRRPAG
jgi:SAM-dependent methyltransferase